MRVKWYLPQTVHQTVYDFLRLHCRTAEDFKTFHRKFFAKFSIMMRVEPALDSGLVHKNQILHFFSEVGALADGNQLARIYEALVYWDVFIEMPHSGGAGYDFRINFEMVNDLERKGCLENVVKGPGFFISKYFSATVAIVVEKNKQESIGSGCIVGISDKTIVLTNKHVLDPAENITVKNIFLGPTLHPIPMPKLFLAKTDDLAAFQIFVDPSHPRFFLSDIGCVLQEVLLMGYPKIPFTTRPHLMVHSGEINAKIETHTAEQLYLISNYASPGSSGGPLLDYRCMLVGVALERLEGSYAEGDDLSEVLFQHSAAVTLERVQTFIDTQVKQNLV